MQHDISVAMNTKIICTFLALILSTAVFAQQDTTAQSRSKTIRLPMPKELETKFNYDLNDDGIVTPEEKQGARLKFIENCGYILARLADAYFYNDENHIELNTMNFNDYRCEFFLGQTLDEFFPK